MQRACTSRPCQHDSSLVGRLHARHAHLGPQSHYNSIALEVSLMTSRFCCLRCKQARGSSSSVGRVHLLHNFTSSYECKPQREYGYLYFLQDQWKEYGTCVGDLGICGPLLDPFLVLKCWFFAQPPFALCHFSY